MDVNDMLNIFVGYILTVIFFYSCVAAYSYAYYVHRTQASTELRDRFQATLTIPSKWLFLGKKPFVERILLSRSSNYNNIQEYFQKASLFEIQVPRIACIIVSIFPMIGLTGIFFIPEKYLLIQYIGNLVIHLSTLFASIRFGHKLFLLSPNPPQ